ncbi:MAG: ribosome small subunit-dependent GTPase A [Spirochaetes bacterium]|nr:ribosome small subunit-dependent GTPase A [Spirochaetota bacterium]
MTGIIIKVFGRFYTVLYNGSEINSVLRGKIKTDKINYSNPVAVGDTVDFLINNDGLGIIESIKERKNTFTRKDGVRSREDIIACNLDQVIAVQSFRNPKLNLRFVDRIIIRSRRSKIPVLVCINKLDLMKKNESQYIRSYYKGVNIDIIFLSALTGDGVDRLKKKIAKNRSLLIGYSGVGKSSIFNRIYPEVEFRVDDVSESSGKGRHTTTNVQMVRADDGTELIDTPGVREFGLVDIDKSELGSYFDDFKAASEKCRFRPCLHDHEPDCEVKRLVEKKIIHEERYISYLNMLYSISDNRNRQY